MTRDRLMNLQYPGIVRGVRTLSFPGNTLSSHLCAGHKTVRHLNSLGVMDNAGSIKKE